VKVPQLLSGLLPARFRLVPLLVLSLLWMGPARVGAFPPAPYYTLYGVVRDQVGATLQADGAEIVLLRDNVEIGRAPVSKQVSGDQNYELSIRIDQNRGTTRVYSNKSVPSQGLYSLYVDLNGQKFFPIEVSGTLRTGQGGERVRLDLNLGEDANHDGLPDAWQEWQLFQAGRVPGGPGWDINLITKDGDFDGDGISNYVEYIAGTFAGDATERFELKLTGKSATMVSFEFYAITGKVYTIEQSTDLRTWTNVAFSLTPGGATIPLHRATAIGVQPAFVAATPGAARFYRLAVR
jgi:hypothetical protein